MGCKNNIQELIKTTLFYLFILIYIYNFHSKLLIYIYYIKILKS